MKIVQLPNPILREKAKPVNILTPKILSIITDMVKTLTEQKNPPGVGLAAPQVGISLQIFLIYPPNKKKIEIFINPAIIEKTGLYEEKTKEKTLEGCLSLHGYYGLVKRASQVTVEYQTVDIKRISPKLISKKKAFTGFPAVIIQHEMDHLEGKVFIDHILEQKQQLYKITHDNKKKEKLEEVKI